MCLMQKNFSLLVFYYKKSQHECKYSPKHVLGNKLFSFNKIPSKWQWELGLPSYTSQHDHEPTRP